MPESSSAGGWYKSSYSSNSGDCVEVNTPPFERVSVRDSKDPEGPHLTFTRAAWSGFVPALVHRELTPVSR